MVFDCITSSDNESESEAPPSEVCEIFVNQVGGGKRARGGEADRIRKVEEVVDVMATRLTNSTAKSPVFDDVVNRFRICAGDLKINPHLVLKNMLKQLTNDEMVEYIGTIGGSNNTSSRFKELSEIVFRDELTNLSQLKGMASAKEKVLPRLIELVLIHSTADGSGNILWTEVTKQMNQMVLERQKQEERANRRDVSTATPAGGGGGDDDDGDDDDDESKDVNMLIPDLKSKAKVGRPKKKRGEITRCDKSGEKEEDTNLGFL